VVLIVSPADWVCTGEACERLGISRSSLYRFRMAGLLLPGQHFHRSGLTGNGGILWNLPAVRLTLRAACWG